MGGKKKLHKKSPKVVLENVTKVSWYVPVVNRLKDKPREFTTGIVALLILFSIPFSLLAKGYSAPVTQKKYPLQKITPEVKSAHIEKKTPEKKYYVVAANESLWHIAEKIYGDGHLYVKLIELNQLPDPNNVEVGTKLFLE